MKREISHLSIFLVAITAMMVSVPSAGQTAGVELNFGKGIFEMTDFKKQFHEYIENSGIPYEEKEGFPEENTIGGTFVVGVGKFETGVDYRFLSTRGSIAHNNNDTESGFIISTRSHALGLFGKYPVIYTEMFQLKAGLLASLFNSRAIQKEYFSSPTAYNATRSDLNSKSLGLTGFIEPVFYFTPGLYAGVRFGYTYDFEGDLNFKGDHTAKLVFTSGDPIKTNWTGLRGDVFIGLRMNP